MFLESLKLEWEADLLGIWLTVFQEANTLSTFLFFLAVKPSLSWATADNNLSRQMAYYRFPLIKVGFAFPLSPYA